MDRRRRIKDEKEMSINDNALSDKDLLNMLKQIKSDLEHSKQTAYELEQN
jgi:hypothetical protein